MAERIVDLTVPRLVRTGRAGSGLRMHGVNQTRVAGDLFTAVTENWEAQETAVVRKISNRNASVNVFCF